MSDLTKNETVATGVQEPKVPARSSYRRKRADVVERKSQVERPSTVVFQASPVSIAGVLAKTGVTSEATLSWGSDAEGPHTSAGAATAPRMKAPLFVIGGGRDLVRNLLDRHPDLSVGPESTLLAEMAEAIVTNRDRLAHEGYPEQYWYKKVAEEFAGFQADRAGQSNKARWVETLDTTALPLSTLDRLFPTSRIVNVMTRGWPRRGDRSTRRSAACIAAGRYLEVRASDVKTDPDRIRRQVLEFLGEPAGVAAGSVEAA